LRAAGPDFVLSPTKLYNATQASSGGMTKMLHGLAGKGYIRRIPNPDDKRSKLVQLTDQGADLAEEIVDRLIATNTELFGSILTDEECITLAGLLQKLSKGLSEKK
jgi:DNA-binding MarR family transcriptional regulator